MLASLVATNPPESIHVHLLHDDSLPAPAGAMLRELVVAAGGRFDTINVPLDSTGTWPASDRFPANAWYRVRLPELLPELHRVLYVDADALLTAQIDWLWETALGGNLLAATTNPLYASMVPRIQSDLGLPGASSYFNSGVLLIDLAAWRAESVTEALREFVRGHPLTWPDQDALNGVLHARRLHLHPRWNAMPGLWELPIRYLPFTVDEVRDASSAPRIVHFVGPYKPWHFRSRHPYRSDWFRYLSQTPWSGREIEGRSVWQAALKPLPAVWAYNVEVTATRWRHTLHSTRGRVRTKLS